MQIISSVSLCFQAKDGNAYVFDLNQECVQANDVALTNDGRVNDYDHRFISRKQYNH